MRDAQQRAKDGAQGVPGSAQLYGRGALVEQDRLGELDVPVAVFVPREFVERVCVYVEAIGGNAAFGSGNELTGE